MAYRYPRTSSGMSSSGSHDYNHTYDHSHDRSHHRPGRYPNSASHSSYDRYAGTNNDTSSQSYRRYAGAKNDSSSGNLGRYPSGTSNSRNNGYSDGSGRNYRRSDGSSSRNYGRSESGSQNYGRSDSSSQNYGRSDNGSQNYGRTDSGSHNYGRSYNGSQNYGHSDSSSQNYERSDSGIQNYERSDGGSQNSGRSDSGSHNYGRSDGGRQNYGRSDSDSQNYGQSDGGSQNSGRSDSGSQNYGQSDGGSQNYGRSDRGNQNYGGRRNYGGSDGGSRDHRHSDKGSQNYERYPSTKSNYSSSSSYERHPSTTSDSSNSYGGYPSTSSLSSSSSSYIGHYGHSSSSSDQTPNSFSSGYESGYTSPGCTSPVLNPTSSTTTLRTPEQIPSPVSPSLKLFDINSNPPGEQNEYERSIEYHQASDTFPCGHVLCHQCLRKFMKSLGGAGAARCPVCRVEVSGEDVSMASIGLPSGEHQESPPSSHHRQRRQESQEAPISLLSNYDEIVDKFKGLQQNLRRVKDESVQSRSMGMTYTNTVCHLCHQSHPTLRVIQEHNQLEVRHERPQAARNQHYFYRLQHGKVVTTFYSKVNASTICVPCTYRELREAKAILPPSDPPHHQQLRNHDLPDVDPGDNQELALAEVGKIMATNTAPLMALKGKNVIEMDHKVRVRERADQFQFSETAEQIERMVRQQEENLLRHATKQVRDTGQLYHVQESNEIEVDNCETLV